MVGKSQVSPKKLTTILRLELTAAVVSVKMSNMLKEEFGLTDIEEFFWTYSRVVLVSIKNEEWRFHTFVANRIQQDSVWLSPSTMEVRFNDDNLADHASRGKLLSST